MIHSITIEARGAEAGRYLSHAKGNLQLHSNQGAGEIWIIHSYPNGQFSLEASGDERGQEEGGNK